MDRKTGLLGVGLAWATAFCGPAWSLDLGSYFGKEASAVSAPEVRGARAAKGVCAGGALAVPSDRAAMQKAFLAAIESEGASPAARAEAERLLSKLLAFLSPSVLANLYAARVTLVIVPANRHILDMPQAARFAAELRDNPTTVDGRPWREVMNFSNIPLPCGGHAWFLNEQSVLGLAKGDNRKGYALVHEFAHMVEQHGLSAREKEALARLHAGYRAVSFIDRSIGPDLYYPFAEMYGAQSREFFPQMSNVWLDAYQFEPGRRDWRGPGWFDEVPPWLPARPEFSSQSRYPRETFTGNLDVILGPSRRHEPLKALLRSIWGESRSVL